MLFDGAVHGTDEVKVYKQLCETAEEWIRILRDDRIPLPKRAGSSNFSGKFMVRIDPTLHRRLSLKAMVEGESLNSLVAKTLAKA